MKKGIVKKSAKLMAVAQARKSPGTKGKMVSKGKGK